MIGDLIKNKGFNINMDSDGILSFLFLKLGGFNNKITGFNTSSDIILSAHNLLNKVWDDVFIDIFVQNKNTVSFDNHVVLYHPTKINFNKLNPNILIEEHFANSHESYRNKYPLSTNIFILSLLEKEKLITKRINSSNLAKIGANINLYDMILRADGVLNTFCGKYRGNVVNWFEKLISYSNSGANIISLFEYLSSLTFEEIKRKNNAIENFYQTYGLTKDGGYNRNISIKENVYLLNNIMRSFASYLGVELNETKNTYHIYEGIVGEGEKVMDLTSLDTYAFVKNNQYLKYTMNFKITNKREDLTTYD